MIAKGYVQIVSDASIDVLELEPPKMVTDTKKGVDTWTLSGELFVIAEILSLAYKYFKMIIQITHLNNYNSLHQLQDFLSSMTAKQEQLHAGWSAHWERKVQVNRD